MNIQISDHFTYRRLIRFVLPSVGMMIFTSIYGVVDGIFVSNFVGKTPFAAINLIMPYLMCFSAFGFMIGTGGSALISKTLGEGKKERASNLFSFLLFITAAGGILFTAIGLLLLRPVAGLLGATGEMLEDCVVYGRLILMALTPFMLQNAFQSFLVTAGKPQLGLAITVAAGLTNILLDALLVGALGLGLTGAALATGISQCVGGLLPFFYFLFPNSSTLRFHPRFRFEGRALLRACTNGSSELMTNLSFSFVNMLYNFQLMHLAGEDGVAAFGVIMYVNFIFISVFIGYSVGCAPIVGFHFGAKNQTELRGLLKKSAIILTATGILLTAAAETLAYPLSAVFVGYDKDLLLMTAKGFMLYSMAFLFAGYNIFASAFFTALNNGAVSALLSFARTLVFSSATILILPLVWGLNGVWLSILVSELLSLGLTLLCLLAKRRTYRYF